MSTPCRPDGGTQFLGLLGGRLKDWGRSKGDDAARRHPDASYQGGCLSSRCSAIERGGRLHSLRVLEHEAAFKIVLVYMSPGCPRCQRWVVDWIVLSLRFPRRHGGSFALKRDGFALLYDRGAAEHGITHCRVRFAIIRGSANARSRFPIRVTISRRHLLSSVSFWFCGGARASDSPASLRRARTGSWDLRKQSKCTAI